MTRLFLIRHGEVTTKKIYYGHLDVPLSPEGVRQLQAAADALTEVKLAAIYTSDLCRAAEGARLIAAPHQLEVQSNAAFREMNLGMLEGLSWNEVRQQHPELAQKRYRDMLSFRFPGGGENLQDVAERVEPALQSLLTQHPEATIALVAHNSVNRIILGQALGLPLSRVFGFGQSFGCVNRILYAEECCVELLNWTPGTETAS
jgi:alpha-ribazole phosphatase